MIALPSITFEGFPGPVKGVSARQVGGHSILSLKCCSTGEATNAQVARRASMSKITKSWKTLSAEQMHGWDHLAEHVSGQSVFGLAAHISGLNLYIRLNFSRTMAGESILADGPRIWLLFRMFLMPASGLCLRHSSSKESNMKPVIGF